MSDETVRLLLRIPSSLKRRLSEMAQSEHRSLNGQIEYLLDRAVRDTGVDTQKPISLPKKK